MDTAHGTAFGPGHPRWLGPMHWLWDWAGLGPQVVPEWKSYHIGPVWCRRLR